jgi:hypothetical protein
MAPFEGIFQAAISEGYYPDDEKPVIQAAMEVLATRDPEQIRVFERNGHSARLNSLLRTLDVAAMCIQTSRSSKRVLSN